MLQCEIMLGFGGAEAGSSLGAFRSVPGAEGSAVVELVKVTPKGMAGGGRAWDAEPPSHCRRSLRSHRITDGLC